MVYYPVTDPRLRLARYRAGEFCLLCWCACNIFFWGDLVSFLVGACLPYFRPGVYVMVIGLVQPLDVDLLKNNLLIIFMKSLSIIQSASRFHLWVSR